MRIVTSWLVVIALLATSFPRAVFASEPPPWFFGPDDDPFIPSADPVLDAIAVTETSNKLGILSARIPFTNQVGQWFEFEIDFGTSGYRIFDAPGGVFGSGSLPAAQAAALEQALRDHRRLLVSTDEPQSKWVRAGVIVGIVGIIIAAAYSEAFLRQAERDGAQAADQFRLDCAAQATNATANNLANASATCPMRVSRRGNQWCTTAPFQTQSASACTGAQYGCMTRCE